LGALQFADADVGGLGAAGRVEDEEHVGSGDKGGAENVEEAAARRRDAEGKLLRASEAREGGQSVLPLAVCVHQCVVQPIFRQYEAVSSQVSCPRNTARRVSRVEALSY
jgi:hypothetical protein